MTQSAEPWRILNVFIRNNIATARIEFAFADFTSPLSSAKPPNWKGSCLQWCGPFISRSAKPAKRQGVPTGLADAFWIALCQRAAKSRARHHEAASAQNPDRIADCLGHSCVCRNNAAHAFTIDPQSGTNFDGSSKYVDPDEQFDNLTTGKNALGQSNGFFNFDLRPFSAPYQPGPSFTPGYPAYRTLPDH